MGKHWPSTRKREAPRKRPKAPSRATGNHAPDWIEVRARMGRAFNERAPLPPGTMSTRGLYSGHGVLVGPEDFDEWLAWSRKPRAAAKRAA